MDKIKIAILAFGSTGDVVPYVALAAGLKAAGFEPRVVTHRRFAPLLTTRGLDVSTVDVDSQEILQTGEGHSWLESGYNPIKFGRRLSTIMEPLLNQFALKSLEACQQADAVVASGLAVFVAAHIAEKLGVPFIPAYLQPVTPTRAFRNPFVPNWAGGGAFFNWLTHWGYWHGSWFLFRGEVNRMRREALDLPELPRHSPCAGMHRGADHMLYGYSASVLARPGDWNGSVHVSGYWFLEPAEAWRPSAELQAFMDAGAPPVCVGFGSMTDQHAAFLTSTVVEALRRNNLRGVLLTGWGALDGESLPETVIKLESAPHEWLFPRAAAVVHHGGAGTTAAGLRAGAPTVIVPFFADQFFWGSVIHRLGAGVAPMARKRLNVDVMTRALAQALGDRSLKRRAEAVSRGLAQEEGVKSAVSFVRRVLKINEPKVP